MILYGSEKVICVFMSDYCVQGTVLDAGDKEINVGQDVAHAWRKVDSSVNVSV